MKQLHLRNAQRTRRLRIDFLRRAALVLLDDLLHLFSYELAVHFISAHRMAVMNQQFLQHQGSTDVITFDYRDGYEIEGENKELSGEIFISIPDAIAQATAFARPWEEEVIRYIVHGVLHLRGYDDTTTVERRKMKTAENRLLKNILRRLG
jgi:probable rRNA maturation factor